MEFKDFCESIQKDEFPIAFPGHLIGGEYKDFPSSKQIKGSIDPYTGQLLVQPTNDREAVFLALEKAHSIERSFANLQIEERVDMIRRLHQALADFEPLACKIIETELGKPSWEANQEFEAALNYLDYFSKNYEQIFSAMQAPAKCGVEQENYQLAPIGTTVAFLPFSTPITSFVKYFAAASLAGCPLILCPSSHATMSGLFFSSLIQKVSFHQDAMHVIFGNFDSFKKSLSDQRIRAIIYTGSREHCELIRRESRSVKDRQLVLQSGGKNAAIVHSSADLNSAVTSVMIGAFKSAGQLCSATSRVFVHKSLIDDFSEHLLEKVHSCIVSKKADREQNFLAPLYSRKAVDKFLRYQTMAHREAEKSLMWGKSVDNANPSCQVLPGIHRMKEFDASSSYQSNVLFCPDLAIYRYEKLDQAIEMANTTDVPYVLSFNGEERGIRDRVNLVKAPNILCNMPTVEIETAPALTGRVNCGQHRFNGPGLVFLLTYPQVIRSGHQDSQLLKAWI